MEYALYFVCFGFGGAMLLYAALLALTRNMRLIPRTTSAKIRDGEAYVKKVASFVAMIALALLAAGSLGLWIHPTVGALALLPLLCLAFWLGLRGMNDNDGDDGPRQDRHGR